MNNTLPTNYSMVDTGLRFKGHPVFLGANHFGHIADKCVLTLLDQFLKKHLPPEIVRLIINHCDNTLVTGAVPDKTYQEGEG